MEIMNKVEHILSKDWLLVLEVHDDFLICRTKDLREVKVYPWEVRVVK